VQGISGKARDHELRLLRRIGYGRDRISSAAPAFGAIGHDLLGAVVGLLHVTRRA
jgi:hypothetical protein